MITQAEARTNKEATAETMETLDEAFTLYIDWPRYRPLVKAALELNYDKGVTDTTFSGSKVGV